MNKSTHHFECNTCQSRAASIFCALNTSELAAIDETKGVIHYVKGDVIFKQGGFPSGLYCVHNGKVKITQTGEDGREQIVRFAVNGDTIGYRALLGADKYRSSAVALDDSMICFVPQKVFFDAIRTSPELSFNVMKLLANDLKSAENRLSGLAQKTVRERMAEALLLLKEKYGEDGADQTINIRLNREEIASIAGTVRETATRMLSEFKDDGLIEFVGKQIKIVNEKKLFQTANITD